MVLLVKNVFFLRGFLVHLENKNVLKSYSPSHLLCNGFCDAILIDKLVGKIFPFLLSQVWSQQHTVSLVICHSFLLGKKGILLIFS